MNLKDEVMDLLKNLDKKNINLEYASERINKMFDEKTSTSNPLSNIIKDVNKLINETKESDSVDHIKEKFNEIFSKVNVEDIKGIYSTIKSFIIANMITSKSTKITKIRNAFNDIFEDLMNDVEDNGKEKR